MTLPSPTPDRKPSLGITSSLKGLKAAAQKWLWAGRIPAEGITLIDGRPGSGKSSLAAAVLAHVTGGPALPGEAKTRGRSVGWLTREEDYASAVGPRLKIAGAKLDRCLFPASDRHDGEAAALVLPDALGSLEEWIRANKIGAVVFDPILSFLSSAVSVKDDQAIRSTLEPLSLVSRRTGCAVLMLRHLRKSTVGTAADQGAGSYAFAAVARVQIGCYSDADDDLKKYVAWIKTNGATLPRTVSATVKTEGTAARLLLTGTSERTANDLAEGAGDTAERSAMDDARAYLVAELTADVQGADSLKAGAEKMGISPRTLRRAKQGLGIKSRLVYESGARRWVWAKPDKWPDMPT